MPDRREPIESSDPFLELREVIVATEPDPVFARLLRRRIERALALPKGVVPVTTDATDASTPTPAGDASDLLPRPAAVPYLAVADARAAIDWYVEVFGATVVGEPIVMPDERIGHAELEISGGVLYLSDAYPDIGVTAPRAGEAAVSLMLPVYDADVVRGRAIDHGASGERPPYDGHGARHAWIVDPFGHRWGLTSRMRDAGAPIAYRHGDVTHVSLRWPDVDRAHRFYADVLGWTYLHDGRVDGSSVSIGFWDAPQPTMICSYAVDDLDSATERVRAAGGDVEAVERPPWGPVARCTDDQGTPFSLHEIDATTDGVDPPANGNGPGELSYLTLLVADSTKARAFYGAVLGWTFHPGHVQDGWGVEGVAPMSGMAGGNEQAAAVPMWSVPDVPAAVEAVRAYGGTATDAQRQPYGLSSECVDDQGMRFYLGEA